MNLIEQLGGYEAAKVRLKSANNEGHLLISVPTAAGCADVYAHVLEKALLAYRREHNIFEVGDLIMYEDELCEIKYIYHEKKARVTDGFQGRTIYDFPNGIRHATDEEIANNARIN